MPPVGNFAAILSGLIASILIFYTMRGGTFTKRRRVDSDRGAVEFSPVGIDID
jgi:hypothetical protein